MGNLNWLDKVFNKIGAAYDWLLDSLLGFLIFIIVYFIVSEIVKWFYVVWFPNAFVSDMNTMCLKVSGIVAFVCWLGFKLNEWNNKRLKDID